MDNVMTAGALERQDAIALADKMKAGREGILGDACREPRVAADGVEHPLLDELEVLVEPRRGADGVERAHGAVPVCSATIPPPSNL